MNRSNVSFCEQSMGFAHFLWLHFSLQWLVYYCLHGLFNDAIISVNSSWTCRHDIQAHSYRRSVWTKRLLLFARSARTGENTIKNERKNELKTIRKKETKWQRKEKTDQVKMMRVRAPHTHNTNARMFVALFVKLEIDFPLSGARIVRTNCLCVCGNGAHSNKQHMRTNNNNNKINKNNATHTHTHSTLTCAPCIAIAAQEERQAEDKWELNEKKQ